MYITISTMQYELGVTIKEHETSRDLINEVNRISMSKEEQLDAAYEILGNKKIEFEPIEIVKQYKIKK